MFLLILESLGSTELLFILVMALVFFGPRKLPQISRTLGKNIADFRRASEDFKRTWEKEVRLEETSVTMTAGTVPTVDENSILGPPEAEYAGEPGKYAGEPVQQPSIQAIAPDRVVARQSAWPNAPEVSKDISPASAEVDLGVQPDSVPDEIQPSTKRDWL